MQYIINHVFLIVVPEDYFSSSGTLPFNIGDSRQCHSVRIVDDGIYESEVEQFLSNMALVSGTRVTVDPESARVIIDDNDECEYPIVVEWNI